MLRQSIKKEKRAMWREKKRSYQPLKLEILLVEEEVVRTSGTLPDQSDWEDI